MCVCVCVCVEATRTRHGWKKNFTTKLPCSSAQTARRRKKETFPSPWLRSAALIAATMSQMQVTVPANVSPGDPFQVNTPAGPMQVTCPPGVYSGHAIAINVPDTQPVMVTAEPVTVYPDYPGAQPVAYSSNSVYPDYPGVPAAPTPATMSRGKMDGRVREIRSGCYYLSECPCCYCTYYGVDANAESVAIGPCCCIPLGCCPVATDKARAIQPGASHFQGKEDALWWESSTSVRKFNKNFDPEQGTLMVKCC